MSFPPDTSKLDERQIMQSVFDEENRRLRTDAIATVSNVSIAVDLDPAEDGVYIADKDSGNKLKVNADGSINVEVVSGTTGTYKNIFNEQSAIASGATVSLVTYTVPVGKTAILERVAVSGENIAKYEVFINGNKIDASRTYFGAQLNTSFDYTSTNSNFTLTSLDIVTVTVRHDRPAAGNFEGRIQLTEIG